MLFTAILLAIASIAFIYLVFQTHVIVHAEQLEYVQESRTLTEFLTRRFPLFFAPILAVLLSIAFGISGILGPSAGSVTPLILVFGTFIAFHEGISFRDRARMLHA